MSRTTIALCGTLGLLFANQSRYADPDPRVLRFPSDRTVGFVYIGEYRTTDPLWWTGFEEVGPATGVIEVPRDQSVWLRVDADSSDSLTHLATMGAEDIQVVTFVSSEDRAAADSALKQLATLSGIRAVALRKARLTATGLRHLTKLPHLEALHLTRAQLSEQALAVVGEMRSLRYLDLGVSNVEDGELVHLNRLKRLEFLALNHTSVSGAGFSHLVDLPALAELHLPASAVTDDGLRPLASVKSIQRLQLGNTKVSDRGIAHLRGMPGLRELGLKGTNVSDDGLTNIATLTGLERLELPRSMTVDGLGKLVGLANLRHLDLSQLRCGEQQSLSPLKGFEKLEYLSCPAGVRDEDLLALRELTGLRELWLQNSPVSDAGLSHLRGLSSLSRLGLHNGHKGVDMTVSVSGLSSLRGAPLSYLWLHGIRLEGSRLAPLGMFQELEELHLRGMPLRDDDLVVVEKLPHLKRLAVQSRTLSDGAIATLAKSTALEDLSVVLAPLTDVALRELSRQRRLQKLVLAGEFTDNGLRSLEGLRSLRQLVLTTNGEVTPQAEERLKESLPYLFVRLRREPPEHERPQVGDGAPEFSLTSLDGKTLSLKELRGKVVVLCFWATWCAPCVKSIPTLKRLHVEFKGQADRFQIIGLSLDTDDALLRQFVHREGVGWPQVRLGLDSRTAATYGSKSVPRYFVIGRDGRIVGSDVSSMELRTVVEKSLGRGDGTERP